MIIIPVSGVLKYIHSLNDIMQVFIEYYKFRVQLRGNSIYDYGNLLLQLRLVDLGKNRRDVVIRCAAKTLNTSSYKDIITHRIIVNS